MRNLYNGLKARIEAECPSIKHIDMWRNQVDNLREQNPKQLDFRKPAVFFRFLASEVASVGNGVQVYDPMIIEVHTVHEFFNGDNFALNLDVFDIVSEVHSALQYWSLRGGNDEYGTGILDRSGVEFDDNHDNIYHHVTTYITTWVDNSKKNFGALYVEPVLTATITTERLGLQTSLITPSRSSIDFGSTEINTTTVESLTIQAVRTYKPIYLGTGGAFLVSLYEDSGFVTRLALVPDENGELAETTIYLKFSPTAAKAYSGGLTYGTEDNSDMVELTGTGVAEIKLLTLQNGDNFLLQNGDKLLL